jgi:hypothetical protein
MIMECLNCGKEFEAKRSTAKYCSDNCRKLAFQNTEVSVPEVSVPEVSVPEVSVPEVSVPEVSVPVNNDANLNDAKEITKEELARLKELNIPAELTSCTGYQSLTELHKSIPDDLLATSNHFQYPNGAFHKQQINGQWVSPKPDISGICKKCGKDLSGLSSGHLMTCCYDCSVKSNVAQVQI